MSRFGGVPVEEERRGGRFGGVPLEEPAAPSIPERIAAAWRGNAAEQAPQALASRDFLEARSRTQDARSWLDNVKQEGRELGASVFGNDADLAKVLAAGVEGSQVVADANGNPMVQLPGGQRVYANQPGADPTDFLRLAGQIGAYAPAAKGAQLLAGGSTLARAGLTGILSGLTNAGGQKVAGREEIDPQEVAVTSAFGAGGELAAPAVSRLASSVMPLFRSRGGAQAAAVKMAREAGIENPTNAQIAALSKALDEIDNGADPAAILQGDEFGFLYTTGQRMAASDPRRASQLAREEFWRSPAAAPESAGIIRDPASVLARVDNANTEALGRFAQRNTGGNTPVESVGQAQRVLMGQRRELRGQVKAAYQGVREGSRPFVQFDGVEQIAPRLRQAVREFGVTPVNTPKTADMLKSIEDTIQGFRERGVSAVSLDALEQQRRVIGNSIRGATDATDRAALTALKAEWDNAIDDVWESSLRSGDPAKLEALKQARALRAEFGRRFNPQGEGLRLMDDFTAGRISPDEAVAKMLGVSQVAPARSIPYIRAIRAASNDSPEVMAQLRAAHFANLVQDSAGRLAGPQAIASNIAKAERNTPALIRELYSGDEWAQMRRLADATSRLAIRGPDSNVTGGGRGLRGIQQLMQQNGVLQTLARVPGVQWAINSVQQGAATAGAARAASGAIPVAPSAVIPAVAASQGSEGARQIRGGNRP